LHGLGVGKANPYLISDLDKKNLSEMVKLIEERIKGGKLKNNEDDFSCRSL
jgi:hypothetical protein